MKERTTTGFKPRNAAVRVHSRRGQSYIELAFVIGILFLLVLGVIDFGNRIGISSRLITAARCGALELTPVNNIYNLDTYPTNAFDDIIRTSAESNSYTSANLSGRGLIIISYLTFNKTANSGNGSLYVRNQFYREPGGGNGANSTWTSRFGTNGSLVSNITVDTLVTAIKDGNGTFSYTGNFDGDWLVAVELFHPNTFNLLKPIMSSNQTLIYEVAIY